MLHQQGCRKQARCFLREAPALGNKLASIPTQQLCAQLHFQQVSLKRVKPIKRSNENAERSLSEHLGKVGLATKGGDIYKPPHVLYVSSPQSENRAVCRRAQA